MMFFHMRAGAAAAGADAANVDAVCGVSAEYAAADTVDAADAGDDVATADAVATPTGDAAVAAAAAGAAHHVQFHSTCAQRVSGQ